MDGHGWMYGRVYRVMDTCGVFSRTNHDSIVLTPGYHRFSGHKNIVWCESKYDAERTKRCVPSIREKSDRNRRKS